MRRPGRLTRLRPVMIPCLRSPYRSWIRIASGVVFSAWKSAMNPSALRIFTISIFIRDAGITTESCRAIMALRIRVSMSAIGSVMTPTPVTSPARLDDAGNLAPMGQRAQADPAEPELPEHRPRPAAVPAAAVSAHLELWRLPPLDEQGLLRHLPGPPDLRGLPHRQPHETQQLSCLLVGPRGRHDRDVHAADLVHLVVLDLREDQLLPQADVHPT